MSYKSILIIKPSSLGDIVHTLPAVAAIREANPEAKPRDCDPAQTDGEGATEAPAPTPIVVTAPSPST